MNLFNDKRVLNELFRNGTNPANQMWSYLNNQDFFIEIPYNDVKNFPIVAQSLFVDPNYINYVPMKDLCSGVGFVRGVARILFADTFNNVEGFGGYGVDSYGNTVVDYYDGAKSEFTIDFIEDGLKSSFKETNTRRHIIMKINKNLFEGEEYDESGSVVPLKIRCTNNKDGGHSTSCLISAILAYTLSENCDGDEMVEIIRHHYDALKQCFKGYVEDISDQSSVTAVAYSMLALVNDLYALLFMKDKLTKPVEFLNFDIFDKFEFERPQNTSELVTFIGDSNYLGKPKKDAKKTSFKKIDVIKTIKDFKDEFKLSTRELSPIERALVPDMGDSIPCKPVVSTAKAVKMSSEFASPQRTFLWRGETGTGKTFGCQQLAQMLDEPYYPMAMSGNTYSDDLLTVITPNVDKTSKEEYLAEVAKLPTDDMNLYNEKCYELLQKTKDFVEIPSPLFYALTQGGVCEMIEANVVKGAQLKVLNSLFDDLKTIYINGKVYHRHPECVIVATYNTGAGYEGIQPFGKDFRSRCKGARTFELPTDNELHARAKAACNALVDDNTIDLMISVYHSMEDVVNAYGDLHDVISPRQLYSWCEDTAYTNNPYESALNTIIGVATDDLDLNQKLEEALYKQFYSFKNA